MSDYKVTDSELTGIANAIRTKGGTSSQLVFPDGFTSAIGAIPTGGGSTLITKNITQNGAYDAEDDNADGYSSVIVNVPSSGGGAEIMTRAEWDALTTAQKQSKGLVGIRDFTVGFEQGVLVYGANYTDLGLYIPYSDNSLILCEAIGSQYSGETSWGKGISPVKLSSALTYSGSEVTIPGETVNARVDLGDNTQDFTAYIVAKWVGGSGNRIISCFNGLNSKGIMLFGSSSSAVFVSSFGSDTSTGVAAADYFVGAIAISGNSAKGIASNELHAPALIRKSISGRGQYVYIGKKDNNADSYQSPATVDVKYVAVVNEYESDGTIQGNLNYLANSFL